MSPTTLIALPLGTTLGALAAIAAAIAAVWLVSRRRGRHLDDGVGGDGGSAGQTVVGGGGGGGDDRVEMPVWEGGVGERGSASSTDTEPFPEFVDEGEEEEEEEGQVAAAGSGVVARGLRRKGGVENLRG